MPFFHYDILLANNTHDGCNILDIEDILLCIINLIVSAILSFKNGSHTSNPDSFPTVINGGFHDKYYRDLIIGGRYDV